MTELWCPTLRGTPQPLGHRDGHSRTETPGLLSQKTLDCCFSTSSFVFPATSLGFTFLLHLLLCSQLHLWGSPFFFIFFCVPSYISGVHLSSSFVFPAISLGFTVLLLLLLCSQLYLWGSPFFFFCVPSYISGVYHSSSFSVFLAISLAFTILLLLFLPSQLYLWGSPFWVRFLCM